MGSTQGSGYEDPGAEDQAQRRERELVLQRLIDDLTTRFAGRPEHEVLHEVDSVLAAEGFVDMPPRWREAVVSAVSDGSAYVVSVDADEDRARRIEEASDRSGGPRGSAS